MTSSRIWAGWVALTHKPQNLTPEGEHICLVSQMESFLSLGKAWYVLKPQLEQLLSELQVHKESEARDARRNLRNKELCEAVIKLLPIAPVDDGLLPTYGEAQDIPEVRALLEEDDYRIPMTVDRLSTVLPAFQARARQTNLKSILANAVWFHLVDISKPEGSRAHRRYDDPLGTHLLQPAPKCGAVDAKTLTGVPEGVEFGSEGILELATSLFRCSCCSSSRDELCVWSFKELTQHIHLKHAASSTPISHYPKYVDDYMARKVLAALALPETTRYEDISGKIVCGCSEFKPSSSFSELASFLLCVSTILSRLIIL